MKKIIAVIVVAAASVAAGILSMNILKNKLVEGR